MNLCKYLDVLQERIDELENQLKDNDLDYEFKKDLIFRLNSMRCEMEFLIIKNRMIGE